MNSSKRRTTRKMGSGKIAFGAFSSGLVVCDRGTPDFLVPYSTCRCVQSIQLQDTIDEIRNVRWDVTRPSSSRRTDTGFKPMSPNWDEDTSIPGMRAGGGTASDCLQIACVPWQHNVGGRPSEPRLVSSVRAFVTRRGSFAGTQSCAPDAAPGAVQWTR